MLVFLLMIILLVLCFLLYKNLQVERKVEKNVLFIQSIYQFSNVDSRGRCPQCDAICSDENEKCKVCGLNSK